MAESYITRSYQVTAPVSPLRIRLMGSNPDRIGLIVSGVTGASVLIFDSDGTALSNVIAIINFGTTMVLPFRDWGPIMQREIFVGLGSGPGTVFGHEFFPVQGVEQ